MNAAILAPSVNARTRRRRILCVLLAAACLPLVAGAERTAVLVLHSGQRGETTDAMMRGIASVLNGQRGLDAAHLIAGVAVAVLLFVLLALGIRRRRRVLAQLRANEEDLRITLQSIGDAVIVTGAEGAIRRLNPVAEMLTGWPVAEALGRPVDEVFRLVNPDTRQPVVNPVANVRGNAGTAAIAGEVALVNRSGALRRIDHGASQICDARGDVVGAVLVFRDVTDRVRIEEQLRQAQRMESVGQLANGIAHDFNNMLAVVLGAADLLAPLLADDKEGSNLVGEIVSASERARQLTSKLLACARRGQLQAAPVDLHRVIRDTSDILTRSIDRRIEIRVELAARWHVLNGVTSQLESLFLNLGVNARDAMPEGGVFSIRTSDERISPDNPLVTCLGLAPGDYLRIEVADTGAGMTRNVMAHVFEPFFTTKSGGHGTGLGLTMVYGAVREHGGNIQVWSEPGQGTQFILRLPVARDLDATPEVAGTGTAFVPGCVLVVDDEPLVRRVAEAMLRSLGCEVLTAVDGLEALAVFEQHHAHVAAVLLDLIMPRMDGRATFEALQRIDPGVSVILSSGYCSNDTLDELLRAGAKGVLMKPYRRDEMVSALAGVMRSSPPAAKPATATVTDLRRDP